MNRPLLPPVAYILSLPPGGDIDCRLPPLASTHPQDDILFRLAEGFPHIFDFILSHVSKRDLVSLRNVCRSLRNEVDGIAATLISLRHTAQGEMKVKTFLGTTVPYPKSMFNNQALSAGIRMLDTTEFSHPVMVAEARRLLPPPPKLSVVGCSDSSLVFPATVAMQHSILYPRTREELLGNITPRLNPGIAEAGIGHVVWVLQIEEADDLRYARLAPDFVIPPTIRHLSIKVQIGRPANPVSRDYVFIPPSKSNPSWIHVPIDPYYLNLLPMDAPRLGREVVCGPESKGHRTFFAQLARAAAKTTHGLTLELVDTESWPSNWVRRNNWVDNFKLTFTQALIDGIKKYHVRRTPQEGLALCNPIFSEDDEFARDLITSVHPPAWQK